MYIREGRRTIRPELTDRQRKVLRHIVRRIQDDGYPPTVREIAEHFGFRSPRAVSDHLEALERKGYLKLMGTARGIQLAKGVMSAGDGFPILGRIAAGKPILSEENYVGTLSMGEMFGQKPDIFALRVEGNSMIGAGIFDGDYVVVKHQSHVASGEIGVAFTEDGATVKRIFDEGERFRLQPENEAMDPIYVSKDDPTFMIGGRVIGVVRKL